MRIFQVFVASVMFFLCGAVYAGPGQLNNVTIKTVGLERLNDQSILAVELNESVVLSGCSAAITSTALTNWSLNVPDEFSKAWLTMLMTAQAQELKVRINYDCNDMLGAIIKGIYLSR